MRVDGIERVRCGDQERIRARVEWEEADLPPREVYFGTTPRFADALRPRGDAFLAALMAPAMEHGERRIHVDGEVCPLLRDGVRASARALEVWWPGLRGPAVEARAFRASNERVAPRVVTTLSGGVDSLASIRSNRLALPLDHPAAFRDALYAFGMNTFDHDEAGPQPERVADYLSRLARWQPLIEETELTVVPMETNVRGLAPDFESWARRGTGGALAGLAHALGGRFTHLQIPCAGRGATISPDGSHPLTDPGYSSATLQVSHHGLWMTRLEKAGVVGRWPTGLAVVQPCQQIELGQDTINCGTCNKCHRTMVELAAFGALGETDAFPRREIDVDFIRELAIWQDYDTEYLTPCVAPLRARGRDDLADALEARCVAYFARGEPPVAPVSKDERVRSPLRRLRRHLRRRRRARRAQAAPPPPGP